MTRIDRDVRGMRTDGMVFECDDNNSQITMCKPKVAHVIPLAQGSPCSNRYSFTRARVQRAWTILTGLVVGYIEEDDEDASASQDVNSSDVSMEGGDKGDGEERRPSGLGGQDKNTTFRIAGRAVMFMGRRGSTLSGDPLVSYTLIFSVFYQISTVHVLLVKRLFRGRCQEGT